MFKTQIQTGNKTMVDMFAHGTWLDERQIPLISTLANVSVSVDNITSQITEIWDAAVVNSLWNAEGMFLYCYPMSEAQCTLLFALLFPSTIKQAS